MKIPASIDPLDQIKLSKYGGRMGGKDKYHAIQIGDGLRFHLLRYDGDDKEDLKWVGALTVTDREELDRLITILNRGKVEFRMGE